MFKKLFYLLACSLLISSKLLAQMPEVEMADTLRQNGKIYVVVIIIAIVFLGIVAYLVNLDRKVSKLEKTK